jgi:DNA-binding NtrC family response regulator
MECRRVLVAEPNDDIWVALKIILEQEGGFEVERTRTYAATLAALERNRPDVILLEPRIAGGNATEFIDQIAAEAGRRGIQLVLMSEWDHAPAIAEKYGLILLARPFGLDAFTEAVRQAAERCSLEAGRPSR